MVSRNVLVILGLTGIWGFADSVWNGTILAAWVYLLAGGTGAADSNSYVGYVEGAQGVSQLVSALPVGYLADKFGRAPVIRVGALAMLGATALTLYAVLRDQDATTTTTTFQLLIGAMCAWGIASGIFNGPMQALFADSLPRGTRSYWYTLLFGAYLLPSVAGPALAIILFKVYGDDWTFTEMRLPFIIGLSIEVVPAALAFLLRDDLAVKESGEGEAEERDGDGEDGSGNDGGGRGSSNKNKTKANTNKNKNKNKKKRGSKQRLRDDTLSLNNSASAALQQQPDEMLDIEALLSGEEQGSQPAAGGAAGDALLGGASRRPGKRARRVVVCGCIKQDHIPIVLFISGLLTALASGMTVKFFPLFFKNSVGLKPAEVQAIYVCVPVTIALLSGVFSRLAKTCGRIQTILMARCIGVSLLCVMALLIDQEITTDWRIIVPIYIIRTGVINCTYPLEESVMMDSVPKSSRARWKSLESISVFGWCGSAAVGGILSDKFGYAFTFDITAALQASGAAMLLFLMPLVPIDEKKRADDDAEEDDDEDGGSDGRGAAAAAPAPRTGQDGSDGTADEARRIDVRAPSTSDASGLNEPLLRGLVDHSIDEGAGGSRHHRLGSTESHFTDDDTDGTDGTGSSGHGGER